MNMHARQHQVIDPTQQDRFDNELGMIGAILSDRTPVLYRAAAAICGPDHFSDAFNGRLFARIGEGVDAGLSAFPLTHWVITQFREDSSLQDLGMGASALIARYIAGAFPAIGVEGCARQIRHDFLKGQLAAAVEDGDTASAEETAAEMERLSKAHLSRDHDVESLATISHRVIDRLASAYQEGTPGKTFAATGLADLSRAIGGWRRGKLYVVAGRPGMGKSTFTLSAMLKTARKGHGVMFFALEMGRQELSEMALCDLAWSPHKRVEYKDVTEDAVMRDGFAAKFDAIHQVAPLFNSLPFFIADRGGLTIAEIRSQAQQYAQRLAAEGRRLDVVCVDHLGLVKASAAYRGNKVAETEEISGALKELAKELDCAVVALAQLSRQVEGRDDKRPNLADLRWSGGIEQDADVVMFVYREAYYLKKREDEPDKEIKRQERLSKCENKIEVLIEKQRGGPTMGLEFFCDIGCAVVRDMDHRHG